MSIYVSWLEDVKAIRFSIGYRGPTDPEALAADALLKKNITAMGLKIAPKLSIKGSTPDSFFMRSYDSIDFCYLIRASSFTSIEDITDGVLNGFKEHISTTPCPTHPGPMEYTFQCPFEKDSTKEKLTAYLSARSATSDDDDVIEGQCNFCSVQ